MSESTPTCPQCSSEYVYQDGALSVCPECAHEWPVEDTSAADKDGVNEERDLSQVVLDANGQELKDGDTVTVVKSLKVKGASSAIKAGTKVKNIRLDPFASDGHNISCKIEGFGAMGLKSEFVKKA